MCCELLRVRRSKLFAMYNYRSVPRFELIRIFNLDLFQYEEMVATINRAVI